MENLCQITLTFWATSGQERSPICIIPTLGLVFTSAAIGLARCLESRADKAGAAAAYRRVPATSSRFAQAQMSLARLLIHSANPAVDDVMQAAAAVEALDGILDGISGLRFMGVLEAEHNYRPKIF